MLGGPTMTADCSWARPLPHCRRQNSMVPTVAGRRGCDPCDRLSTRFDMSHDLGGVSAYVDIANVKVL